MYDLQIQSLNDTFHRATQIYRRHFAKVCAVAFAVSLPFLMATALVNWVLTGTWSVLPMQEAGLVRFFLAVLISIPIGATQNILLEGMLVVIMGQIYLEQPISTGAAFRRVVAASGSLIGATVLIYLGMAFGTMLFIVPGILFLFNRLLAGQAIMLEGCSAIESLKRSKQLLAGRRWRLFMIALICGFFLVVINMGTSLVLPKSLDALPFLKSMFQRTPIVLINPIYYILATLIYFDARAKTESFDLERLSKDMSHSPS